MTILNNMAECASKNFMKFKNYLYKNYGESPGKMLVHTGVLGWILSSAAQVFAVVINDKIPPKEKMFLIPQEFADAAVNILSFYIVTNSFTSVGNKLVKSGKLLTPKLKKYVDEKKIKDLGKITTDISQGMTGDVRDDFMKFKGGVSIIFSTLGSILSCNIITPLLRNQYAARKQKEIMAMKDGKSPASKTALQTPAQMANEFVYKPLSMADYQKAVSLKFSGNNLRI